MSHSISVITPSLNQGSFIERTVTSVLNQNIKLLDYVVIDGGSSDETVKILKKYKNSLRFVSEADRGQAHAVNKGIMMTDSTIIGWLNADDVYYPTTLMKVLNYFNEHPEIDVVYGKANHIDKNDLFIELYPTEEWNKARLKKTCFISQPAVFFKRSLILRSGLLNEQLHYCLDYEYWLRLAEAGARFAYYPNILSGSRLHESTKTLSAPEKAQLETLSMLRSRLGYVPTEWLLQHAISKVKKQTHYTNPQIPFIFLTAIQTSLAAMKWNGIGKGLVNCLTLPQVMWSFYQKSKLR